MRTGSSHLNTSFDDAEQLDLMFGDDLSESNKNAGLQSRKTVVRNTVSVVSQAPNETNMATSDRVRI